MYPSLKGNKTVDTIIEDETNRISIGGVGYNANGGFVHGAELSWIGEDGPEVIIPLGEKRRARGLSLWKQAGEMLGRPIRGIDLQEKTSYEGLSVEENELNKHVDYFINKDHASTPVQVSIAATPVININGTSKDGDIVNVIRSHIKELADDMCGEIADKITVVFSNIPQNA